MLCDFQNGKLPRIKDVFKCSLTLKSEKKVMKGQHHVMESLKVGGGIIGRYFEDTLKMISNDRKYVPYFHFQFFSAT